MRAGKICTSMLSLVRGERENRTVPIQTLVDETLSVLARDPSQGRHRAARAGPARPRRERRPGPARASPAQPADQRPAGDAPGARQRPRRHAHDQGRPRRRRPVRINVADTGPGIAERNLPRIFEPFFTTKTQPRAGEPRGSGLGLHICKQIVETHGGRIEVESTPGRGTTFGVLLPAA